MDPLAEFGAEDIIDRDLEEAGVTGMTVPEVELLRTEREELRRQETGVLDMPELNLSEEWQNKKTMQTSST